MNAPEPVLETRALSIGYRHRKSEKLIAGDLNVQLFPGELVGLLGANGAGKSTFMRTLAGLQPALSGEIKIESQPLDEIRPEVFAKKLSLVLTDRTSIGNLTAREVISLGRAPYTSWLGTLSGTDHKKISQAIANTGVENLLDRNLTQLSDGERQKVMLARALAQDTPLIFLDEPTAHLDLPNRIEMMRLLQSLARKTKKAILLTTHELDLALQTADKLWLLDEKGDLKTGVPEDLVLDGSFEAIFAKRNIAFDQHSGTFDIYQKQKGPSVFLTGDEGLKRWTKRALQRQGFSTDNDPASFCKVIMNMQEGRASWEIVSKRETAHAQTVDQLIREVHFALNKYKLTIE